LSNTTWTALGPAPILGGQTPGNGPVTGRIAAIAADPSDANIIYIAAAGGGVWKTTDGGTSWTPLTDSQSTLTMGAIAIAPSNTSIIYAGTGEANFSGDSVYGRGILKSTDGGTSWTLLGQAYFDRLSISRIVVDPTNANTVYATDTYAVNGVYGNYGVWKSTDGGVTWNNTTSSISTGVPFTDLVMDPSSAQVLYAAAGDPGGSTLNGIYKTVDGGAHWALAGNFPSNNLTNGRIALALAPSATQTLYAAITSSTTGGIYKMVKSVNGGTNWTTLPTPPNYMGGQGWYDTTLIVDPSNAGIVYAAGQFAYSLGSYGFIRSSDGGSSWTEIGTGTDGSGPHPDHHGIAFDASGKLLDGNDGGIWRLNFTSPSNYTWTDLNGTAPNALNITQFTGIALHPTNPAIAYGGSQDNGTERYTGSAAWNLVVGGDGGFVRVDPSNPNTVYHEYYGISLERSDDGGVTWHSKISGINLSVPNMPDDDDPSRFYVPYVLDPSNPSRLLYGTDHVYETTNRGDNWTPISAPNTNGWTTSNVIDSLAAAPSDINTIYASAGGQIFVTTNRGATWTERSVPSVFGPWVDLHVDPTNSLIAYAVRYDFGGGHVYRTVNGGVSWANISSNLPDLPVSAIDLNPNGAGTADDVLYVGTDAGVYTSANLGGSWTVMGSGLPSVQVADLEFNSNLHILGAGTHGRGLWEISVLAPGVDLVGSGFTVNPSNLRSSGGTTTAAFSVTNSFDDPAGSFNVKFYLSDDATINPANDILLNLDPTSPGYNGANPSAYQVASLAGHGTFSASPILDVPTSDPFSTDNSYYIGMVIDADANVTEVNEGNNRNTGVGFDQAAVNYINYLYSADMSVNPGWTFTGAGQWAWGQPLGQGATSHGQPDPTSGHTGTNVMGVNLAGDYSTAIGGPFYVTTPAINCSGYSAITLDFWRWLNSDYPPYVAATIDVSNNGTTWTNLFTNPGSEIADSAWQHLTYNLDSVANGQSTVYIRWGYQVGASGAYAYSGWNIDDVTVTGIDNVAPLISLTSPANGAFVASTTPTISGVAGHTSGDSTTVTVNIYAGSSASGSPITTFTTTANASTGAYSAPVPAGTPLGQGTYTVQTTQSDLAGNIGLSAADTFTVDTVAPTITQVYVRGSAWTPAFLNFLATAGQGSATLGYRIPTGSALQMHTLPWANINQISVVFSEGIAVVSPDLTITGTNVPSYNIAGGTFNYSDSPSHVATWTLPASIGTDGLLLKLVANGGTPMKDEAGNLLDGEWNNGVSTVSGNGSPGGDFTFQVKVLPADANGDNVVSFADFVALSNHYGQANAGGSGGDLNGDGTTSFADFVILSNHYGAAAVAPPAPAAPPPPSPVVSRHAPAYLAGSIATGPLSRHRSQHRHTHAAAEEALSLSATSIHQ
jgi:hypothetical protein